ncbi:sulfate ABC transporter permease subunit CysW [Prosthecobacter vanneervenii]|uniref:Sulfate transport system permease protein n=1 Tax=Prosthecobacter vanneervenii TaxID=48466 RepID=A0A7W8DJ49_9BACT|nr:sulfate ABC transporter permease subunit CysW [Prosthecobacter vanneervenii]MBB5031758.1 sulfate transport system permease protein [Prosthecobacter vanneervenii]
MPAIIDLAPTHAARPRKATADSLTSRILIIGMAVGFMGLMFVLPLIIIFQEAFRKGWEGFAEAFDDRATTHAIWLTLKVAAITVPLNTLFGLAAAWCLSRFRFQGRRLLSSLIELPLWVSPVIAGMVYVLLFGAQGLFGPSLKEHGIKIIFALPGIVLSTIFVTFTFVARVLAPQMEAQGQAEEEAAMTLGANGWQMFWRVTLPKIKWGLLYGIILCNARSMGEFGAVSVVSGHIRNKTNTVPLHIEVLYNEYQFVPAFAVASVLALLALVTLILKTLTTTQRGAA